jgi:hypothetical protein
MDVAVVIRSVCECVCVCLYILYRGTWWHSWLRHCATSRKVAGSIQDSFIGIFHWHNPSGRTMALGLTQHITEMSTRLSMLRGDNLITFMWRLPWNLGASTSWNPQGLSRGVQGLLYLYFYLLYRVTIKEIDTFNVVLKHSSRRFASVMSRALTWCWRHEKNFIFPLRYYANFVSTALTVSILHNVQSVYFFYSNPV